MKKDNVQRKPEDRSKSEGKYKEQQSHKQHSKQEDRIKNEGKYREKQSKKQNPEKDKY